MARVTVVALVACKLALCTLQASAATSSLENTPSEPAGYEILKEKINFLQENLLLLDCGANYAQINTRVYLQNASGTMEDVLRASRSIAPIYLTVAQSFYDKALVYYEIAVSMCSSD